MNICENIQKSKPQCNMVSIFLPAKLIPSTLSPVGEGMADLKAAVFTANMEAVMKNMEAETHKLLNAVGDSEHHLSITAEKLTHMELRSNFSGHDAGAVAWRRITAELGKCGARVKTTQHQWDIILYNIILCYIILKNIILD